MRQPTSGTQLRAVKAAASRTESSTRLLMNGFSGWNLTTDVTTRLKCSLHHERGRLLQPVKCVPHEAQGIGGTIRTKGTYTERRRAGIGRNRATGDASGAVHGVPLDGWPGLAVQR